MYDPMSHMRRLADQELKDVYQGNRGLPALVPKDDSSRKKYQTLIDKRMRNYSTFDVVPQKKDTNFENGGDGDPNDLKVDKMPQIAQSGEN